MEMLPQKSTSSQKRVELIWQCGLVSEPIIYTKNVEGDQIHLALHFKLWLPSYLHRHLLQLIYT